MSGFPQRDGSRKRYIGGPVPSRLWRLAMAVAHLGRRVYVPDIADESSVSSEATVSCDHRCLPSPALEAEALRPRRLSQVATLSPLPVIDTFPVNSTGSLISQSPPRMLDAGPVTIGNKILVTVC